MNISSSWVAESTLFLRRPRTKVETMAEMPAAMPLIGQHGFGFFHEPGGPGLHLPDEAKQSDHYTSDIHDKVPRLRVLGYRVAIG